MPAIQVSTWARDPHRARNLCFAAMLEAVRDRVRNVDLKQVNRVLLQPHWREHRDLH